MEAVIQYLNTPFYLDWASLFILWGAITFNIYVAIRQLIALRRYNKMVREIAQEKWELKNGRSKTEA